MSRLDFAPKLTDIKLTDIKQGLGEFTPKPGKAVSFAVLKTALKKAGYTLASADITVQGTLIKDDSGWWLEMEDTKQRFAIAGDELSRIAPGISAGSRIEIKGDWQTVTKGGIGREVIRPKTAGKLAKLRAVPDGNRTKDWDSISLTDRSLKKKNLPYCPSPRSAPPVRDSQFIKAAPSRRVIPTPDSTSAT